MRSGGLSRVLCEDELRNGHLGQEGEAKNDMRKKGSRRRSICQDLLIRLMVWI